MSSPLKAFDIEFVKLKLGEHHFEYSITNDFFEAFDSSLKAEDLKLSLQFTRGTNTFALIFKLHGKVKVECDRCLTEIDLPIQSENTLMVKVTENILEDQDDIIYILPSEFKLNISQPLYDFILLSLPIKKTCDKVGKVCDPSITGKIDREIDVDLQTTDAERATDIETD